MPEDSPSGEAAADLRPTVLIAAQSGRALAEAARRAGLLPLVADLFADLDTRAAAHAAVAVPGRIGAGFRLADLVPALDRLRAAAPTPPIGLVLGSGFEDRPRAVGALDRRFGVIGCSRAAIAAAKNPERLATLCATLGIAHPEVVRDVPDDGRTWITKRIGASGGTHIRFARGPGPVARGRYAEPMLAGRPVSLTFLSGMGAGGIVPVGFARQVFEPTAGLPFRFGGLVAPVRFGAAIEAEVVRAAAALATALGLRGIATLDFLVHDEGSGWPGHDAGACDMGGRVELASDTWTLMEINPRPGHSLDVMDHGAIPLFTAHVAAARGETVDPDGVRLDAAGPDETSTVRASRIVYAEADIASCPAVAWPDWVRDRPEPGTVIGEGEPIATVVAEAGDEDAAFRAAEQRVAAVRRLAGGA